MIRHEIAQSACGEALKGYLMLVLARGPGGENMDPITFVFMFACRQFRNVGL
jgi:hypothetical protein